MKILLINPNTSAFVTDRMTRAAQAAVGDVARITGVTAAQGPAIVGSRSEDALAGAAALDLAAQHEGGFDAVLLGISTDAGLVALRELLEIPVAGMLEAALLTAAQLGGRIGLLTLGSHMLPLYQERAAAMGLAARVPGWRGIELPSLFEAQPGPEATTQLAEHARRMAEEFALDVIVLSGAVLAGYRAAVQPHVPVPVVDGIEAAAWQAVALGALGCAAHRMGSYARPRGRTVTGAGEALMHRLRQP